MEVFKWKCLSEDDIGEWGDGGLEGPVADGARHGKDSVGA